MPVATPMASTDPSSITIRRPVLRGSAHCAGAVAILGGINVKHDELQNDGPLTVGH